MLLNQLSRALYEIRSTKKTNIYIYIYTLVWLRFQKYIYIFCSFGRNKRKNKRYIYLYIFLKCQRFCKRVCVYIYIYIFYYLFCFFQGENAGVAYAKRFAKRRVCSLVSVQVMKTPVKFAVNKEILVYPTEPTTLVVRSIS